MHGPQVTISPSSSARDNVVETFSTVTPSLNVPSPSLLPHSLHLHHPRAGLNPLVDAAGYLFTVMGQLKAIPSNHQLPRLQKELVQEINLFKETAACHGYHSEYILVCCYVLCAALDECIADTLWGGQGQWDGYSLLAAFKQDIQHHDKFFVILERAMKEPMLYIDLMELIYICLSLGYRGQYRINGCVQPQFEQIFNNLYRHIRSYRGSFSKALSPLPLKSLKIETTKSERPSPFGFFVFFIAACVIMTVFASLGYLMDTISNEAYKNITQVQSPYQKVVY